MRGKLAFVVGAAVGYVLGSRAGRERYEQIKRGAKKLWNTGPVQQGVGAVRGVVDDRADDLKETARRLGSQLLSKMSEQAAGKPRDGQGEKPAGSGGPKMKSSAAARATEAAAEEAEPDQAKS